MQTLAERIFKRQALYVDCESLDHTMPGGRVAVRHCVGMSASACTSPPSTKQPLQNTKARWERDEQQRTHTHLIADHPCRKRTSDREPSTEHQPLKRAFSQLAPTKKGKLECTPRRREQPRRICLMNERADRPPPVCKKTTHAALLILLWLAFNPTRIHRRDPPGSSHESGGDKLHDLHLCCCVG